MSGGKGGRNLGRAVEMFSQVQGFLFLHGWASTSPMDGNEVSQGSVRMYRCRVLLLFTNQSQCIVVVASKSCWQRKDW